MKNTITKKQYKWGGKKKGLGGMIGTGLGAVAGGFLGNPMLGAQLGGMAGGVVEKGFQKEESAPQPTNFAHSSLGYASGGYLPEFDENMSFGLSSSSTSNKKSNIKSLNKFGGNTYGSIHKAKGGKIKPIGQDATEIEGKSHEQGGVELNENTEVEGGETMDNVNGEGYVFSKRLKIPGTSQTFAEAHKQMVKNNADPEAIERLAQLQEKIAGRN